MNFCAHVWSRQAEREGEKGREVEGERKWERKELFPSLQNPPHNLKTLQVFQLNSDFRRFDWDFLQCLRLQSKAKRVRPKISHLLYFKSSHFNIPTGVTRSRSNPDCFLSQSRRKILWVKWARDILTQTLKNISKRKSKTFHALPGLPRSQHWTTKSHVFNK